MIGLAAVYVALALLGLAGGIAWRRRRAARRVRCALYHIPGPGGRALRIGITCDPDRREDEYARTAWWWYQRTGSLTVRRWYPDTAAARRAETVAIGRERPPRNDQHNPDRRRGRVRSAPRTAAPHLPPTRAVTGPGRTRHARPVIP